MLRLKQTISHLNEISGEGELNARPIDLQSTALPPELSPVITFIRILLNLFLLIYTALASPLFSLHSLHSLEALSQSLLSLHPLHPLHCTRFTTPAALTTLASLICCRQKYQSFLFVIMSFHNVTKSQPTPRDIRIHVFIICCILAFTGNGFFIKKSTSLYDSHK